MSDPIPPDYDQWADLLPDSDNPPLPTVEEVAALHGNSRPSRPHLPPWPPADPAPDPDNHLAERRATLAGIDPERYHERAAILEADGIPRAVADRLAATPPPGPPLSVVTLVLDDGGTCTYRPTCPLPLPEVREEVRRGFIGHRVVAVEPWGTVRPNPPPLRRAAGL